MYTPIVPAISVIPNMVTTPAELHSVREDPLPVYRSPKVVKVIVAPYINAKGEAFPETYKYVFADEGGWNIEALRKPERAYIPADNVQRPLNAPGVLWGSLSPGFQSTDSCTVGLPARKLFNLNAVHITGLLALEEEAKARQEAEQLSEKEGNSRVAVYDDALGWLILPQTAMGASQSSVQASPMLNESRIP